jgi:hypothetical protein
MSTKRRVIVEVNGRQNTVDYDVQYDIDGCYGAKTKAIRSFVWESSGSLDFAAIGGESNYDGWSRCVINVSGPICTKDDCLNPIETEDEKETQICWECQEEDSDADS